MYDLHTHSTFSDGVLIPSEVLRRAYNQKYKGIAITDHADFSNYKIIIENLLNLKREIKNISPIKFIAGIEITHLIPEKIPELAKKAKEEGADIVLVHGETIVEPVAKGTNYFALTSPHVDILAHPGLISEDDLILARNNKIAIEITTRKGHSLTNGYVFKAAKKYGINLVINNDAHTPSDFVSEELAKKIVIGAGGTDEDFYKMLKYSERFFK